MVLALSLPRQFYPWTIRALFKLLVVMHGGSTKRPGRFRILLDPHLSGSTPPVDGATSTCALGEGSAAFVNQTIISHLPTRRISTNGLELERAQPRYSRTLGQSYSFPSSPCPCHSLRPRLLGVRNKGLKRAKLCCDFFVPWRRSLKRPIGTPPHPHPSRGGYGAVRGGASPFTH